LIYLLDINAVSDLILRQPNVTQQFNQRILSNGQVGICRPVYFELMRGLLWKNATRKMTILRDELIPELTWIGIEDEDWLQAAKFWAQVVKVGRQFSDVDLLLAAIAQRLDATLVTADADFDFLSLRRENWRTES
jgi:predicted nucleic acid-binding protein